jgi:hypothetical protein
MIIYFKVTEIFCLVDEFCKEYSEIVDKALIGNPAKRPSVMSQSEVINLAIIFQLSGFRTFKHFYVLYVKNHMN